jgi:dihydroorotase
MVARDLALAELTGGRLHLAHLSTAGSVALVRRAKERGIPVTAEVCPHHLTITDQWALGAKGAGININGESTGEARGEATGEATAVLGYDTSTKVYPPLRRQADADALVAALAEGIIDCVATDHAPHDVVSKRVTYQDAAFGISVLETALGSLMQLVHEGKLPLAAMVQRLTTGPAAVLGPAFAGLATLQPGTEADLVVFDPDQEWVVDTRQFASKGKNTPLEGTRLKGRVAATLVAGRVVYQSPSLQKART